MIELGHWDNSSFVCFPRHCFGNLCSKSLCTTYTFCLRYRQREGCSGITYVPQIIYAITFLDGWVSVLSFLKITKLTSTRTDCFPAGKHKTGNHIMEAQRLKVRECCGATSTTPGSSSISQPIIFLTSSVKSLFLLRKTCRQQQVDDEVVSPRGGIISLKMGCRHTAVAPSSLQCQTDL